MIVGDLVAELTETLVGIQIGNEKRSGVLPDATGDALAPSDDDTLHDFLGETDCCFDPQNVLVAVHEHDRSDSSLKHLRDEGDGELQESFPLLPLARIGGKVTPSGRFSAQMWP